MQRFEPIGWLRKRGWKPGVVALLLLLFLAVQFLARSSAAHQLIHHDAKAPDHHCVVTVVADGLIHFTPACHTSGVMSVGVAQVPAVTQAYQGVACHGLPAERAPPASA